MTEPVSEERQQAYFDRARKGVLTGDVIPLLHPDAGQEVGDTGPRGSGTGRT
jgi:hypothetical protein